MTTTAATTPPMMPPVDDFEPLLSPLGPAEVDGPGAAEEVGGGGGTTRPGPFQPLETVSKMLKTAEGAEELELPYRTMLAFMVVATIEGEKGGTFPVNATRVSLFEVLGVIE